MSERVTLKQLAREAGVGLATASRALSGDPRCAEATRARVQAAAERLGYRPDPALSALVSHRAGVRRRPAGMGIVLLMDHGPDYYYMRILDACRERAGSLGYGVELIQWKDYPSPEKLGRVLVQRGTSGVVVFPIQHEPYVAAFPWQHFSCIGFLQPVFRPQIHLVRDNAFRSVFEGVAQTLRQGRKRPGLVLFTSPGSNNDLRQIGAYLAACSEAGPAPVPPLPVLRLMSTRQTQDPLRAWFREHRPDVVVCNTGGAYYELQKLGVRIPGRCAYVNLLLDRNDAMAGFDPREELIGRALIDQLDGMIRRNERGLAAEPHVTLIDRVWRDGPTLPAPKDRKGAGTRQGAVTTTA